MKFTITFKTPNAADDALAIAEAKIRSGENECYCNDCPVCEDRENVIDRAMALTRQFIEYDEYVRIEFDVDAGTATVLKVK